MSECVRPTATSKARSSREETDKRHDRLMAEKAAVQRLLDEATAEQPTVTPELIEKLAEVFGSWPILRREECLRSGDAPRPGPPGSSRCCRP
jgi:hypothetical protein